MKRSFSLRTKVLLLALLNVVLAIAVLVRFAQTQLNAGIGSLLISEAKGRMTDVAMQLARELPSVDREMQNDLLRKYSGRYGVTFYLFEISGVEYAGPAVELPQPVLAFLRDSAVKAPLAQMRARRGGVANRAFVDAPELNNLAGLVTQEPFFSRSQDAYWVMFRMPLRSRDQPAFFPGVLVLASPNFFSNPLLFDSRPWLILGAVIILIAVVCWLPLIRGVTRSMATLSAATTNIARGKFGAHVRINRTDELGQLGDSFNRMSNQLEGYVHGQKRFLRDAAHELRSPIARLQAAIGNVLESDPGPEAAPFIEAMREEIELMSSLTGELLAFAREESVAGKRALTTVKLSEAVARAVATENPSGTADVRVEIEPDLHVVADSESLFRSLSNIVRNAIRYAGDAGPIVLAASKHKGSALITVTDKGPGIPEESLELIFTPFYRIEDSRNRKTGGNGLGMAIARTCIENCRGTIYCRNQNPGLQVTITLKSAD